MPMSISKVGSNHPRLHGLDCCCVLEEALWCLAVHCGGLEGLGINVGEGEVHMRNTAGGDIVRLERLTLATCGPMKRQHSLWMG